jgi:hypothetical protein
VLFEPSYPPKRPSTPLEDPSLPGERPPEGTPRAAAVPSTWVHVELGRGGGARAFDTGNSRGLSSTCLAAKVPLMGHNHASEDASRQDGETFAKSSLLMRIFLGPPRASLGRFYPAKGRVSRTSAPFLRESRKRGFCLQKSPPQGALSPPTSGSL